MTTLIERVIEDIKKDPSKLDKYLQVLAKQGLLRDVKELRLKSVSSDLLKELANSNVMVYIK